MVGRGRVLVSLGITVTPDQLPNLATIWQLPPSSAGMPKPSLQVRVELDLFLSEQEES